VSRDMKDIAYVALTLLLFALSWLYVKGLERL
jgi:predicted nucleic acid-binding protein